jgi:hypothetical protein
MTTGAAPRARADRASQVGLAADRAAAEAAMKVVAGAAMIALPAPASSPAASNRQDHRGLGLSVTHRPQPSAASGHAVLMHPDRMVQDRMARGKSGHALIARKAAQVVTGRSSQGSTVMVMHHVVRGQAASALAVPDQAENLAATAPTALPANAPAKASARAGTVRNLAAGSMVTGPQGSATLPMRLARPRGPSAALSCRAAATPNGWPRPRRMAARCASPRSLPAPALPHAVKPRR